MTVSPTSRINTTTLIKPQPHTPVHLFPLSSLPSLACFGSALPRASSIIAALSATLTRSQRPATPGCSASTAANKLMMGSLAVSLARSGCCTSAPMLGAVGAVAHSIRPWLATCRSRRSLAALAQEAAAAAVDSDSDADPQQPSCALPPPMVATPPPHHSVEEPSPIPAVTGRIHSVDTFSAVDGPGLRMVVFEQGCAMRCAFCSNPDTWSPCSGESVSSKSIASQLRSVAPYLRPGGGGITCSGGEALLQPHFTAALFQEAHALGLTTCLDTTGQGTKHLHWDVVLPHTDMVLFCIKHLNPEKYAELTGLRQAGALKFAAELKARGIPHWLRYVLIPGHTDDEDGIQRLIKFCKQQQPALQGIECLPYHLLGRNKWEALGIKYPLDGVETPSLDAVLSVVQRLEAAGINVICDAKRQAADLERHLPHNNHGAHPA